MLLPKAFWKYCQEEGSLWTPEGGLLARGYSGHDAGLNNPELQNQANIGPIPEGLWFFGGELGQSFMGPVAIMITPGPTTVTYGRNGFSMHGDTAEDVIDHTKDASHGCLVFPRLVREEVMRSTVKALVVVRNEGVQP